MGKTKIEWADYTFNPWIGCTHVSEGCEHCYAERQDVQYKWTESGWGVGKPRKLTSSGYWGKPHTWNRNARMYKVRYKVFCGSLMDVFDDEVPQRWRDDLWTVMENTPLLDWQLLTKRPHNVWTMTPQKWHKEWPKNVWVGMSAENQKRYDERIGHLLEIPAPVLFLSLEPLLGRIDVSQALHGYPEQFNYGEWEQTCRPINWVIVGAESGRYARPMDEDWVKDIVQQCRNAHTPIFYKQSLVDGKKTSLPMLDGEQFIEFPLYHFEK